MGIWGIKLHHVWEYSKYIETTNWIEISQWEIKEQQKKTEGAHNKDLN